MSAVTSACCMCLMPQLEAAAPIEPTVSCISPDESVWVLCAGAITTLGRGGSDLSATVIGAALGLAEVQVWKDVDGKTPVLLSPALTCTFTNTTMVQKALAGLMMTSMHYTW